MKLSDIKDRQDAIVERKLAIDAELARMKHQYVSTGVSEPLVNRTALECERAELAVELSGLTKRLNAGKKSAKVLKEATVLATLVRMLRERGLDDLVIQAERDSVDQLMKIGALGLQADSLVEP